MEPSVGVVVLAAGASRRLGTAKQAVLFAGQPLIVRATETALASALGPVVVVLGAEAPRWQALVESRGAHGVFNPDWESGMAGSIRCGLARLAPAAIAGAVLMVCDQPLLTPAHLCALVAAQGASGRPIAASAYAETAGVPAYFARAVWDELLALTGEGGAKRVIGRSRERVVTVPFPAGAIDLDTPADLERISSLEL